MALAPSLTGPESRSAGRGPAQTVSTKNSTTRHTVLTHDDPPTPEVR